MPVEPPPSIWQIRRPSETDGDLVAIGADLEPGTILSAYRSGLFPMPLTTAGKGSTLGWWSPEYRGILPLDGMKISRSLRKSCRRFEIRVDTAFGEVITACANPRREGSWIDDDIANAYKRLHELGWAHSVEAWNIDDSTLAGGLYGVAIGGLFAGESMFHRRTDASKVALVGLVELLEERGFSLLDVQWETPHLSSLGVIEVSRLEYEKLLESAIKRDAQPLGPLQQPLRVQPLAH